MSANYVNFNPRSLTIEISLPYEVIMRSLDENTCNQLKEKMWFDILICAKENKHFPQVWRELFRRAEVKSNRE